MGYQWFHALSDAITRNRRDAHNRYVQLATVGVDGYPANRTVVFRGFLDDELLTMVTDARSAKLDQIRQNPKTEVCWYFTRSREQFRIRGELSIVSSQSTLAGARRDAWSKLSFGAREQFFWPTPGAPLRDDERPVVGEDQLPQSFLLLALSPEQVDHLQLAGTPQRRWRSVRVQDSWRAEAINP